MLKRRDRIERLDEAIADGEQKITEQVLLVMVLEAKGRDFEAARRLLKTLEDVHVEYLQARKAIAEAQALKRGERS